MPTARTQTRIARWMRRRRTRVGRTTLPPIARGGPLGEAARWKTSGPDGSLRSHERPHYRTLNPHCNLESERPFAAPYPLRKGGKRVSRVARGRSDEHVERFVPHIRQRRQGVENVLGRVVATAKRLGCEERRVGLDEESILRRRDRRHAKVLVLRVRDVPREREPV